MKLKALIVTTLVSDQEQKDIFGVPQYGEAVAYFPENIALHVDSDPLMWVNTAYHYVETKTDDARERALVHLLEELEDAYENASCMVVTIPKKDVSFWREYFDKNLPDVHEYDISFFSHVDFLPRDGYLFRPIEAYGVRVGNFIPMFKEINDVFSEFFDGQVKADDFDTLHSKESLN